MSGIDASRLAEELNALLEQGRIVTWLDRNGEYADDLDAVQELLDGAALIPIDANLFGTKLSIFAKDTKSRFVLYRRGELPPLEEDLLADVRCGYPAFTADASTLLVRELGVDPALAAVIDDYAPFFKSTARVADLKKHLGTISDADKRSDRKTFLAAMSAVLLKTQQRSFSVLFAKLASMTQDNPLDALKWGLDAYFWEGAYAIWGYDGEHTFDALMTWLFVMNANGWDHRHNSAQRDFSMWTRDVSTRDDARRWAKRVDEATGASSALYDAATDALLIDTTTPGVDRELISRLVCGIVDGSVGVAQVEEQRGRRREGLWFEDTEALWDAARAGARLLTHLRALPGITFSDAAEGFARYTDPDGGLWAIDQEYRHYVCASQAVHVDDVLTDLDRHVENAYRDDYLRPLSRTWDDALRGMRTWDIAVPSSSGRIDSFHRLLVAGTHRRTVVIISDALRYEAGVELADHLRSLGRGAVAVNPWYTMLPSITALGMAALLPHRELTLGVRGKDQVIVETDGRPTSGIDARRTILEGADGRAFTYEELKQDTIKVMRSKFKGASAVYIYHDVIDATGDHAASESATPDAVNRAIDELSGLVGKLISADITRILVTADHGFLFQDSEPANDDTAKQGGVPRGRSISVKKRRYILGKDLESTDDFVAFDATSVSLTDGPSIALPYGTRRIRIQGRGNRFVHGGASLQEITIPVIEVSVSSRGAEDVRDVGIALHYDDTSLKVNRFSPRVIQQEPISPTRRPLTVTIRLESMSGEQLSSTRVLTLDAGERSEVSLKQSSELILFDGVLQRHSGEAVRIVAYKTVHGQVVGQAVATHELTLNDNGFGGFGGFDL